MKIIKRILLIITLISSLFSDIIPGLTSIFVSLYLVISSIYLYKKRKQVKINKYYIIIFINIVIILISTMLNFSASNIKFIMYLISIIFIMEEADYKDFKSIFNILTIFSIIIGIYIIIVGKNFDTSTLDFVNVRQSIIIQKQSYNTFMNIILPYLIIKVYNEKDKKCIIPLIINIISSIFIFQIKTLIMTIPISFIIIMVLQKKIKFIKFINICVISILGIYIIYKFNIIQQLTPIIDYLLKGEESKFFGNKYIDTLLLRKEILIFAITLLKEHLFWGIGYNNFGLYSVNQLFYVRSKGQYVEFPNVTESGFLSFLVEGGVLGGISISIIFINILKDISKILKSNIDNLSISIILAFICLLISNVIQDNLNFTFWSFIGYTLSIIKNKERIADENINC